MFAVSLSAALSSVLFIIFLVIALGTYSAIVRQISRRSTIGDESTKQFRLADAVLAFALIAFLLLVTVSGAGEHRLVELNSQLLIENLMVELGVVLVIAFFMTMRGLDINALGGFSNLTITRAVSIGLVLLVLAYPLLNVAEFITEALIKDTSSKQNIVELFTVSGSIKERVLIIVFAVAAAPVIEEFLFRLFLYGVLRRYFGWLIGALFNALLFAAVHNHLPSFLPLFVLGICLTTAYEWSGSILVSMTMHSLFNAASLTLLAFPELLPQ
jgi:membrane protease YdiL (CAAX protease family)